MSAVTLELNGLEEAPNTVTGGAAGPDLTTPDSLEPGSADEGDVPGDGGSGAGGPAGETPGQTPGQTEENSGSPSGESPSDQSGPQNETPGNDTPGSENAGDENVGGGTSDGGGASETVPGGKGTGENASADTPKDTASEGKTESSKTESTANSGTENGAEPKKKDSHSTESGSEPLGAGLSPAVRQLCLAGLTGELTTDTGTGAGSSSTGGEGSGPAAGGGSQNGSSESSSSGSGQNTGGTSDGAGQSGGSASGGASSGSEGGQSGSGVPDGSETSGNTSGSGDGGSQGGSSSAGGSDTGGENTGENPGGNDGGNSGGETTGGNSGDGGGSASGSGSGGDDVSGGGSGSQGSAPSDTPDGSGENAGGNTEGNGGGSTSGGDPAPDGGSDGEQDAGQVSTPPAVTPEGVSSDGALDLDMETATEEAMAMPMALTVSYVTPDIIISGFEGKYFRLGADVDLSSFNGTYISATDGGWESMWIPIGSAYAFNGVFDGGGKTISSFTYTNDFTYTNKDGAQVKVTKTTERYGFFGTLGAAARVDGLVFSDTAFSVTDGRMNTKDSALGVVAGFNGGLIANTRIYAPDSGGNAGIELQKNGGGSDVFAARFGGAAGYSTGTVANCVFIGSIHSGGETKDNTGDRERGVGGMIGVYESLTAKRSGTAAINCIVNGDITFGNSRTETDPGRFETSVGFFMKIGGILGNFKSKDNPGSRDEPTLQGCIYGGSIRGADSQGRNAVGGIAGDIKKGYIYQCISDADILWGGSGESATDGGTGGIVGLGTSGSGTVEGSFAMGNLSIVHAGGGVAGRGVKVIDSYCSGSVSAVNETPSVLAGGLAGVTASGTGSISNSYFSGGITVPQPGSILGLANGNLSESDRVFYDCDVTANGPAVYENGRTLAVTATGTAVLCSESFSGLKNVSAVPDTSSGAVWLTASDHYPRLMWAESLQAGDAVMLNNVTESGITVSSEYADLVKSLSDLSTASDPMNTLPAPATGSAVMNAAVETEIAGVYNTYPGNIVGKKIQRSGVFTAGEMKFGLSASRIELTPPKADNIILDEDEFYKFLDYWQAGGAPSGSEFMISASAISLNTPILPLPDYNQGAFCGSLNGEGAALADVQFAQSSRSLLGNATGAEVKDLSFEAAAAGISGAALDVDDAGFGLLFGNIGNTKVTGVTVSGLELHLKNVKSGCYYGGLAGRDFMNSTFDRVSLRDINVRIGDYRAGGSGNNNNMNSFGGLIGKISGSVRNCSVENLNAVLDLNSCEANNDGYGGLAGNNSGEIVDSHVRNSYLKVNEAPNSRYPSNVGGVAGFINNSKTISGCSFTGELAGMCVGGITAYNNYDGKVYDSFFAGRISSTAVENRSAKDDKLGGIVGFQTGSLKVLRSFAFGRIDGDDYAGGLVGFADKQTATIEDCYVNAVITADKGAGGLMGNKTGASSDSVKNVYFAGQVHGAGGRGGIVGYASAGFGIKTLANVYYDKQIAGRVTNIGTDKDSGNNGMLADRIRADVLNPALFTDRDAAGSYPELAAFAGSADEETRQISEMSARRIFFLDADASSEYLQGIKFSSITVNEVKPTAVSGAAAAELVSGAAAAAESVSAAAVKEETAGSGTVKEEGVSEGAVTGEALGAAGAAEAADGAEPMAAAGFGPAGFVVTVTPEALYYVNAGGAKTAMMVRAEGSDQYVILPENTLTEEGTLTAQYRSNAGFELDVDYTAGLKAFDYGTGTESDPFIIYNEDVFLDFVRFVSKGRDNQSVHYIIAEVTPEETAGGPITLHMDDYSFAPAMGLSGTLHGNNSTIENVSLQTVVTTDAGVTYTYQGIFGRVNATATVEDLTVRGVRTSQFSASGKVYSGGLAAYAGGGTFRNIALDSEGIMHIPSGDTVYAGGLIGCIDGRNTLAARLSDITVAADLQGRSGNQNAGLLAGGILVADVTVERAEVCGSVSSVRTAGGLIGIIDHSGEKNTKITSLAQVAVAADVSYSGNDGILGGVIGYNSPALSNSDTQGAGSPGFGLTMNEVYQSGLVSGGRESALGGLIGKSGLVIETGQPAFDSSDALGNTITDDELTGVPTVQEQADDLLSAGIVNCMYRYDLNPYRSMNLDIYGHFTYYPQNPRNAYRPYEGSVKPAMNGKNQTWNMASGTRPAEMPADSWQSSSWTMEKGVFPILTHAVSVSPEAVKLAEKVKFHSIALFMTRAGKAGENKYQNVFITFEDETSPAAVVCPEMRFTSSGAMGVATGANTPAAVTLRWRGFEKTREFTASTEASGIADFSWYVINPKGMWACEPVRTAAAETGEDGTVSVKTTVTEKLGWTLYTADQLQGLALLTEVTGDPGARPALQQAAAAVLEEGDKTGLISLLAEKIAGGVEDGNGVSLTDSSFYVPADRESVSGDTTTRTLYRIMLGRDINDMNAYKPFRPIGTAAQPFVYGFDGMGHVLGGLHITATDSAVGLFGETSGATLENTGILSGEWDLSAGSGPAGTLAGRIQNGTAVRSCFATSGLMGGGSASKAGGLIGESAGGPELNTVENNFFTGAVQLTGDAAAAGGIASAASNTIFRQNFVAGYVEAVSEGAIVGRSTGGNQSVGNVFDKNAAGNVYAAGEGVSAAAKSTSQMVGYGGFDDSWVAAAGYYPVPAVFSDEILSGSALVPGVKESVRNAAIPAEFLPFASSASEGRILYAGDDLTITQQSITWDVPRGTAVTTKDALGYPKYLMDQSGMIWLKLGLSGTQRDMLFNLRCWYDDPVIIDGQKTYTVSAASELAEFSAIVNGTVNVSNPNGNHKHGDGDAAFSDSFENCVVLLGDDVHMDQLSGWTSAGAPEHPFRGTFDGQEHVIFDLNQQTSGQAGLFGTVSGAVIRNVGMQGGSVQGEGLTGGLAARITAGTVVENCFTSLKITGESGYAGGLAGSAEAGTAVKRCFSMSVVDGPQAAGIAGKNEGTIRDSYFTGIVSGSNAAAGIAAENGGSGAVAGCFAAGAFLSGGSGQSYGIAPGNVTGCWFDKQMTGRVTAVEGASGVNTAEKAPAGYYQDSAAESGTSDLFRAARGLSVLALDFENGTYSKFTQATANRKLSQGAGALEVAMKLTGEVFRCVPVEDDYLVSVDDASEGGSDQLTASVIVGGELTSPVVTKPYYLYTKPMISIRYHFIFSQELQDILKGSGAGNPGTGETADVVINTAEELRRLTERINSGQESTENKIYRLGADIAAVGPLEPIGTEARPFNGTFDGGGRSIDGVMVDAGGYAGFFGTVGTYGKVKNLDLTNLSVTAEAPGSGNLYAGLIAARNEGALVNVTVTGQLRVNNSGFAGVTYLGGLTGENRGRVEGSSFVSNTEFGIYHSSRVEDLAGGFAGLNAGSFTGCFISSNMTNTNIKAMAGNNAAGSFRSCYYNCGTNSESAGTLQMDYVYDDVPVATGAGLKFFVPYSAMNEDAFAEILSSSLYGGTWVQKGRAYPQSACADIMNMDLGRLELMLAVRNLVDRDADPELANSFMNGIATYWNFGFPYFSNVSFNKELQMEMPLLDRSISYSAEARIYGSNATWADVKAMNAGGATENAAEPALQRENGVYKLGVLGLNGVTKPRTIMLNITLSPSTAAEWPWGVYRTDTEQ